MGWAALFKTTITPEEWAIAALAAMEGYRRPTSDGAIVVKVTTIENIAEDETGIDAPLTAEGRAAIVAAALAEGVAATFHGAGPNEVLELRKE